MNRRLPLGSHASPPLPLSACLPYLRKQILGDHSWYPVEPGPQIPLLALLRGSLQRPVKEAQSSKERWHRPHCLSWPRAWGIVRITDGSDTHMGERWACESRGTAP